MAKIRFLIDPNTFWMILGTSKIVSEYGPGDLLIITKMLQKIQEKIWNHPGKYYLCQSGTHKFPKMSQFWTHQTPIFFESFCPPPHLPQKNKFVQAFSKNFRWWILGILGQSYF